jgi:hypothetical protein
MELKITLLEKHRFFLNGIGSAHNRSRPALGKASKALGEAFAERSSRQNVLGKNPIGKGFFAESRLSGTRQRGKA